jgi:hypothetical protein
LGGEVHMLSHLKGSCAHQLSLELAEAERRQADLEARLRRCEQAKLDALAERDAARSALNGRRLARRCRPDRRTAARVPSGGSRNEQRLAHRLAKCLRALVSARGRAHHAQ